jgi:hypothetical protein
VFHWADLNSHHHPTHKGTQGISSWPLLACHTSYPSHTHGLETQQVKPSQRFKHFQRRGDYCRAVRQILHRGVHLRGKKLTRARLWGLCSISRTLCRTIGQFLPHRYLCGENELLSNLPPSVRLGRALGKQKTTMGKGNLFSIFMSPSKHPSTQMKTEPFKGYRKGVRLAQRT